MMPRKATPLQEHTHEVVARFEAGVKITNLDQFERKKVDGKILIMARDGSSEGDDKKLGWQKPWDQACVIALDAKTGKERWQGRRGLSRISHGVPNIWEHDGKTDVVSEAGDVVQGFDFHTGERLWQERVGGNFSASPVGMEGRIYCLGDNGETTVIEAGPEFKVLAKNPLGEKVQASMAISQGKIFIRTANDLYCIGAKSDHAGLGSDGLMGQWKFDEADGAHYKNIKSVDDMPVGEWIHLAGTYDNAVFKLYVNGTLARSEPYSTPFKYQDVNPIIIGGNTNSKGKTWVDCFHGRIDDVRLYNRALTEEEILQISTSNP